MLSIAISILSISLFGFVLLMILVQAEQRKGKRYVLSSLRGWLDKLVSSAERWYEKTVNHFVKYVVQLNWYYGIHSLLRTALRFIVACYEYVERVFERNRLRTKRLRAEKLSISTPANHLTKMAEHKEETALSQAQKNKRNKKHLEGDN